MADAPATLPVEYQKQMDAAAASYRDRVLSAGVPFQTKEGTKLIPRTREQARGLDTGANEKIIQIDTPSDAIDERYVIDLDIPEVDERTIVLRGKDGETEITIQSPIMDAAFMLGRYEAQLSKKYERLSKTEVDAEAERLNKDVKALYLKMVRLLVPDMTAEFLNSLHMRVVRQIVTIGQEMVAISMGMANVTPLIYVRSIYRRLGSEYGDHDRGLMIWLKAHFADFEEALGDADLPND